MEKQERFVKAFAFLRENGYIHTQKDLAVALKSTEGNVSRMLKGDPKVLTDNMCKRLSRAFGMISVNWLIHGDGEMVVVNDNNEKPSTMPDYSSMVNSMLAGRDAHIIELENEIKKLEESHKRELEAKEETIHSLRQQVNDLRFVLTTFRNEKALSDEFHFPPGAADDSPRTSAK